MADGRRKKGARPDDFDCGPEFFDRVEALRKATQIERMLTCRLEHLLSFLELVHDDEYGLNCDDWDRVRHHLFLAGLSDPETWPDWCFQKLARVGDSDGMRQGALFG